MTDEKSKSGRDYLVRSDERGDETRVCHPLNPDSELYWTPLSDRVGMERAQLHLARLAPGKESFLPHAHMAQEEFVFILEGNGEAEIGGQRLAVGPGDYMGFPTDGTTHSLRNTGEEDLVYLMGGERGGLEVAFFPTRGKVMIAQSDCVYLVDEAALEKKTLEEWMAESQPERDAEGPEDG